MQETTTPQKGSLLGASLLIAGCCIGAGMLGLPAMTLPAGFFPSLLFFILSWIFMMFTGLLLLEVNLWVGQGTSIITMAGKTLGKFGQALAWLLFLFLFYCIMIAYSSGSGLLIVDFLADMTSLHLPPWAGSIAMVAIFGLCLYGGTRIVDHSNRLFMMGLFASYLLLVALGLPHIDLNLLTYQNWAEVWYVVPPMIISFGYHNLIPTLNDYMGGDAKRLRLAILIGSSIPLAFYLIWELLILGLVPAEGPQGALAALDEGEMVTRILKWASGSSLINTLAQAFAFFAIVTSFLGVGISLIDFMADGLHIRKTPIGKGLLCLLAILPPLLFSLVYPGVFLTALNYAGGFAAVTLFGLLPAWMAWISRRPHYAKTTWQAPGGVPALILVSLFAFFVITMEAIYEFVL